MSDTDSFINEVSEEVRRDRMFALWKTYGPYVIGGIVGIVGLAGVMTYLDQQEQAAARAAGGALLTASDGDAATQAAAMEELAKIADHDGEALLATLRAAGAWASAGDPETAAALYDDVAADASADPILKDYAAYRAVALRAAKLPPAEQAELWAPLANDVGAFRLLALEARGVALSRAGDAAAAEAELKAAYFDEAAPPGLKQRISALATALGLSIDN